MSESGIFKAAVRLPTHCRAAFLDQACGPDQLLRREVESLLQAHDASGGFLQDLSARPQGTVDYEPITEQPGTLIGPYKLMEQIGEGGFGLVFVAEQHQPVRRKVALKIIKPGMDTREVIARFEAERQALALMDHPNIARVLDAGATEAGRPYFVMELVRGVPITNFCDENRLTPCERLELFVSVCQAVQHAHQKGIIHRDLKPSNVLVTLHDGKPVAKVIDFGVAKAIGQQLTERTVYTRFLQMVGTPLYMSPEQAEMSGLDIDTRTDIYSLGVLLYELLTGSTPFDKKRLATAAYDEIRRIIREEEPPKPSTRLSRSGEALPTIAAQRKTEPTKLSKLFRGELDWIVMKCLDKERGRRYETANGLARDIQRYLADEPVEACPPTVGYRARKLARKHKAALITAAMVAVLLAGGVVASAWQAIRAIRAERLADTRRVQVEGERDRAVTAESLASERLVETKRERDRADYERKLAQAARDAERRTSQSLAMKTVETEVRSGNFVGARRRLMQLMPELGEEDRRGLEWYYWYRQTHGGRLVSSLPKGEWDLGTFSPGGACVAMRQTRHGSAGIEVFEVSTMRSRCFIPRQTGYSEALGFSADGARMAIFGWHHDGGERHTTLSVWDCESGALLFEQESNFVFEVLGGRYRGIDLSLNGRRVAVANSILASSDKPGCSELQVWDVDANRPILKQQVPERWTRVRLDPAGKQLVAFSAHTRESGTGTRREVLAIYDVETGKKLSQLLDEEDVDVVEFTPDGKQLVVVGMEHGGSKNLWVWDPATDARKQLGTGLPPYPSLSVSPDGVFVTAGGRGSSHVRVWHLATGHLTQQLPGHAAGIDSLVFDRSQKNLLTLDLTGAVRSWPLTPPEDPFALRGQPTPRVLHFRLSADRALLAVICEPEARGILTSSPPYEVRVRRRDGTEVLCYRGDRAPDHLRFSPDGKRLGFLTFSGFGETQTAVLHACDPATGKELWTWNPPVPGIRSGMWSNILPAPPQRMAVLRTRSTAVKQPFSVHPLVFSADGSRLAFRPMLSAIEPQTVHVLDAANGQPLHSFVEPHNLTDPSHYDFTFHDGVPYLAGMVRDGNGSQALAIVDGLTGRIVAQHTPKEGLPTNYQVQPGPSGRHAAVWVRVRTDVWDVAAGERVVSLDGDWQPVFSTDGARVALLGYSESSGSAAVAVQIYDLRDRRRICQITAEHMVIDKVRFSADGTRLLTRHHSPWHLVQEEFAGVRIWDVSTGHEVMSVEAAREFYSVWDIDFDATGRQLTLVEFLRPRQLPGRFEVLDGSPLPASEEANLRGPRVAQRLFDKLLIRDDVVAAIQNDPHLTAEIRVAALTAASGLRESADPNALNTASWRIVEVPNQAPDAYRQALRWAEVAAKRQPEWAIINTLGVAQYRMQQFADAIKTLERAAEIGDRGDPHPVDYAALAMAHHRLGHGEEARRHLKQVDDLMKLSKWASDPECLRFQKEVEQLIPRKDASLP